MDCVLKVMHRIFQCFSRAREFIGDSGGDDNRRCAVFCCICNRELTITGSSMADIPPSPSFEVEISTGKRKKIGGKRLSLLAKKPKIKAEKSVRALSDEYKNSCVKTKAIAIQIEKDPGPLACSIGENTALKIYIGTDWLIYCGAADGSEDSRTHIHISSLTQTGASISFPASDLCCFYQAFGNLW